MKEVVLVIGDKKMNNSRRIAIIVGVLYILGTVAGIFSVLVTQPVLKAPDFLA